MTKKRHRFVLELELDARQADVARDWLQVVRRGLLEWLNRRHPVERSATATLKETGDDDE